MYKNRRNRKCEKCYVKNDNNSIGKTNNNYYNNIRLYILVTCDYYYYKK